jgi:hypothetical protein
VRGMMECAGGVEVEWCCALLALGAGLMHLPGSYQLHHPLAGVVGGRGWHLSASRGHLVLSCGGPQHWQGQQQ